MTWVAGEGRHRWRARPFAEERGVRAHGALGGALGELAATSSAAEQRRLRCTTGRDGLDFRCGFFLLRGLHQVAGPPAVHVHHECKRIEGTTEIHVCYIVEKTFDSEFIRFLGLVLFDAVHLHSSRQTEKPNKEWLNVAGLYEV